jgi:uncharacterized membrane protein YraQ (UPF0718 family)
VELLLGIVSEFWIILNASSLYLLLGFLIAGLIHVFISSEKIIKYLGKGKVSSVMIASLLGVPIPLCSCGVIPAAAMIRKKGANKGATISFMISTPESGVTSIAISYALIDLTMAIARPIAAFVTAVVAGLTENLTGKYVEADIADIDNVCEIDGCCDGKECDPKVHISHHTMFEKIMHGMRFTFGEMMDDISKSLIIGLVLAAIASYFLPSNLVSNYLGNTLWAKLAMLVIGIPIYICASASTPIVAALILKGMSPGTALVFLMAGPATNLASLAVVSKIVGKKATAIYLSSIAVCSVLLGILLDFFYVYFLITPTAKIGAEHIESASILNIIASMILLLFVMKGVLKRLIKPDDSCCSDNDHDHDDDLEDDSKSTDGDSSCCSSGKCSK